MSRARLAVAAVVIALLAVFVALPLVLVAGKAVASPDAWDAALSGVNRAALENSLLLGIGAAALALFVGAPLGAALARLDLKGAGVLQTLLVLPLAAPSYVWAMAWIALAAPKAGWLNQLAGGTWIDIYGLHGIVWVEGLALFPLVLLPTRAALESADPSLEEAARVGGAGALRAFLTGSAPLAAPAAASGALLAFLAAISSFGVPYLLGVATAHPALVATTRIYQAQAMGAERDLRGAVALCLILLLFAAAAATLAARAAKSRAVQAGKGRRISKL
ncbi:MAG TPA: ABC transporter permease subunit, partial [bacterium]|nr:ABC transporter permease subunit [bacterium]